MAHNAATAKPARHPRHKLTPQERQRGSAASSRTRNLAPERRQDIARRAALAKAAKFQLQQSRLRRRVVEVLFSNNSPSDSRLASDSKLKRSSYTPTPHSALLEGFASALDNLQGIDELLVTLRRRPERTEDEMIDWAARLLLIPFIEELRWIEMSEYYLNMRDGFARIIPGFLRFMLDGGSKDELLDRVAYALQEEPGRWSMAWGRIFSREWWAMTEHRGAWQEMLEDAGEVTRESNTDTDFHAESVTLEAKQPTEATSDAGHKY